MSLYNRLFQENKDATALLGMISCTRDMFQRYRDVFLNVEGNVITVLTRLGGGNRKDYQEVFDAMKCSPYYIRDYDWDGMGYFRFTLDASKENPTYGRSNAVQPASFTV